MTHVFAPKITYRIPRSLYTTDGRAKTPWQYLEDWNTSDHNPTVQPEHIATRMKSLWPGNYRIVIQEAMPYKGYRMTKWVLEFDDPAEETMFRLKWCQ